MKPSLAIVIPNLNGRRYLAEALESVQKQTLPSTIIVVDNGSSDGSVELVEKEFPKVTLLKLSTNRGFAGGVNYGIQHAIDNGVEAVALFNNDAVAEKDWLKHLFNRLNQDQKIGIVTGKFMRDDRKHFDSTGDFYTIWGFPFPRGRDEVDTGQFNAAEPVFGASGGATLYRSKTLKEIGLFDEEFFAYLEDVDISFRAQARGWKVWYEPAAVAYHKVGATSSQMSGFTAYHFCKNFFYTYAKNMPTALYFRYLPRFCISAIMMLLNYVRIGRIGSVVKAIGRLVVTVPYITRLRRANLEAQTVSNDYIDGILAHTHPPKSRTFAFMRRITGQK